MDSRGCGGFAVVYGNVLLSVGKIGFKPGEGSAGDSKSGLETGEEYGVVDGVKCSGKVKEDEDV